MSPAPVSSDSRNRGGAPFLPVHVEADDPGSEAFRRAVEAESQGLLRFVQRRFGPRDAEDTVQEALAQALQRAGTFDQSRPVGPWLRTIAVHCRAKDGVVRPAPGAEVSSGGLESPRPCADGVDERDAVEGILGRVDEGEADLLRRHHLEGASVAEIAADTGAAPGTIKSRLFRARKKLALALGAMGCAIAIVLLRWPAARPEAEPPVGRVLHASVTFKTDLPRTPRLGQLDLKPRPVAVARTLRHQDEDSR